MSSIYFTDNNPTIEEAVRRAHETFPFYIQEMSWEQRRIVKGISLCAV